MKKYLIIFLFVYSGAYAQDPEEVLVPGNTLKLSYETEGDILSDFLSSASIYRKAKPGATLENSLERRQLDLSEGRFGKALHIKHGWSIAKGTNNESGIDLDLTVATMWGDWHTKPHYWGTGKFSNDRGSVAFWVKTADINPGLVFIQGSISWGRKERDLLRIDLSETGNISASIRDIYYQYHKIESKESVWENNTWQHIVVVYDKAYGLKLYHNNKLIASNWGNDAWWEAPMPGLFSPFLPESYYDEISFYDYPLDPDEISSLFNTNLISPKKEGDHEFDQAAKERLLSVYGDINSLEIPALTIGEGVLAMKQTEIANCHDEKIPAWWVMDGRYELAWPHPNLLFTFILGDADFHGDKLDIELKHGETANYLALEGVLEGVKGFSLGKDTGEKNNIVDLENYANFFYSKALEIESGSALHFPLVTGYGTPPGLIDKGSLNFPLSGKMRIHEVQLWNVTTKEEESEVDLRWPLTSHPDITALGDRYYDALLKLKGAQARTLLQAQICLII